MLQMGGITKTDADHKLRFKVTVCNYVHAEETVGTLWD